MPTTRYGFTWQHPKRARAAGTTFRRQSICPAMRRAAALSCAACGHASAAGSRFCAHCGAKLGETPAPLPPSRPIPGCGRGAPCERRRAPPAHGDVLRSGGSTALVDAARSGGFRRRHLPPTTPKWPRSSVVSAAMSQNILGARAGLFRYPEAIEADAENAVRSGWPWSRPLRTVPGRPPSGAHPASPPAWCGRELVGAGRSAGTQRRRRTPNSRRDSSGRGAETWIIAGTRRLAGELVRSTRAVEPAALKGFQNRSPLAVFARTLDREPFEALRRGKPDAARSAARGDGAAHAPLGADQVPAKPGRPDRGRGRNRKSRLIGLWKSGSKRGACQLHYFSRHHQGSGAQRSGAIAAQPALCRE